MAQFINVPMEQRLHSDEIFRRLHLSRKEAHELLVSLIGTLTGLGDSVPFIEFVVDEQRKYLFSLAITIEKE